MNNKQFLPISKQDMSDNNIEQLDYIIVTGDAYVDHPTFGTAIISRVLESQGHTVGIIAQPNTSNSNDIARLGVPKYAFLVNSGNVDSMVANYTVAKKRRTQDDYSPEKKAGKRPDRAVNVYCSLIRQKYGDIPIIIGGIEASLRRFAHYDYWEDTVLPSIMVDSGADLLVYGMGELQTIEYSNRLKNGESISDLTDIKGTCYLTDPVNTPIGSVQCPDFDIVSRDKKSYAKATLKQMNEQDEVTGKVLTQRHGKKMLVQNIPMPILTTEQLDWVYTLPFTRKSHPVYDKVGGISALNEVEFSIPHNRGCFGGCNFCAIAFHQGRRISSRSEESILEEAHKIIESEGFKGYIHDVGGPTANFRIPSCKKQDVHGMCRDGKKCLAPDPCKLLEVDHTEYLSILRKLRALPKVKKVFIRSGIRYDYMLEDKNDDFFNELVEHHISGQLKVAPEHCSAVVLDKMGKPHFESYKQFSKKYFTKTKSVGKEQYLVPYLMSSHPGATLDEAIELALFLKQNKIRPEQVQDFYPTPGTISTCMYYTGIDPYTNTPVYVAKTNEEKSLQRALLQYYRPENQQRLISAFIKTNNRHLIGDGDKCLVASNNKTTKKVTYSTNPTNKNKNRKKNSKNIKR